MRLRERFKQAKAKTKSVIDQGKMIKYVNRLESLFKQGNIGGILEFIKPLLESEGYEVDILKDVNFALHEDGTKYSMYDYAVFIKKKGGD
jgi:hypothetical protein